MSDDVQHELRFEDRAQLEDFERGVETIATALQLRETPGYCYVRRRHEELDHNRYESVAFASGQDLSGLHEWDRDGIGLFIQTIIRLPYRTDATGEGDILEDEDVFDIPGGFGPNAPPQVMAWVTPLDAATRSLIDNILAHVLSITGGDWRVMGDNPARAAVCKAVMDAYEAKNETLASKLNAKLPLLMIDIREPRRFERQKPAAE